MPRETHQVEIEGRKLTLSNPDKVLFPEPGFAKAQVVEYYVRVSEWLLPHLRDRPVTLKRYPNGIHDKHFYEKDAPRYTPSWVRTFPVPRHAGGPDIRYVVIDDLPTLVWAANLANLEIHPFLHRVPDIDRPTMVVFDLDPGEGAGILDCARVALQIKEVLDGMGLQSFPKVSGSKGIQLTIPLNTPVTYAETQPFAHNLAQLLERENPDRVVSEMAKAARRHKVFIDWSQNADHKTTVCVYSMRAKREQPYVSMPVTWDELARAKKPEALDFPPDASLKRLAKMGDLYAPVLKLKQKLPKDVAARSNPPRADDDRWLKFVEPMMAKLAPELPEGKEWLYEVKFDGYRTLAMKKGGELTLFSRRGNRLNSRFPTIASALEGLPDGTMLDGEVIALDDRGLPSFNVLQNSQTTHLPVQYYVFDLLAWKGRNLMDEPLATRRRLLADAAADLADPVRISDTLHASPRDLIAAARQHGLEGVIAKRANSRYEPGKRSGVWLKYKVNRGQELVIGGYLPGPHYFGALLVGYYDSRGRLIFNAKIKNGFVPRTREEVFRRCRGLETDICPFSNLPEPKNARRGKAITSEVMQECRWLKPELVAQIEYTDWTAADHLRHSKFVALRDYKDPREVVKEESGTD
jgi:bifunctional non-homologous end joining protein LigD